MHTTPFDTPSVASATSRPPTSVATSLAAAALTTPSAPALAAAALTATDATATLAAAAVAAALAAAAGAASVSSPAPSLACEFHIVLRNHALLVRARRDPNALLHPHRRSVRRRPEPGVRFDPPSPDRHGRPRARPLVWSPDLLLHRRPDHGELLYNKPLVARRQPRKSSGKTSLFGRSARTPAPAAATIAPAHDRRRMAGDLYERRLQRRTHSDDPQRVRRAGNADPRPPRRHRRRAALRVARVRFGASPRERAEGRQRSSGGRTDQDRQPRQLQSLCESGRQVGVHQATPRGCGPHASLELCDGRWRALELRTFAPTPASIPSRKGSEITTACASQAAVAAGGTIESNFARGTPRAATFTAATIAAAIAPDPAFVAPLAPTPALATDSTATASNAAKFDPAPAITPRPQSHVLLRRRDRRGHAADRKVRSGTRVVPGIRLQRRFQRKQCGILLRRLGGERGRVVGDSHRLRRSGAH